MSVFKHLHTGFPLQNITSCDIIQLEEIKCTSYFTETKAKKKGRKVLSLFFYNTSESHTQALRCSLLNTFSLGKCSSLCSSRVVIRFSAAVQDAAVTLYFVTR